MARTFKFSFPLPSRWSSAERQPALMYDGCEAPPYNPGSKAEMILGTSERPTVEIKAQPLKKEKNLRRNPSFMSVTISEFDSEVQRDEDGGSERSLQLQSQASSSLLGQQYVNASPDQDSAAGYFGLQHRSQSSSTLRSYYDSSKSPLNISQQTSASSARDMALRKGHRPIASPKRQEVFNDVKAPRVKERSSTKDSVGTWSRRHPRSDLHLDLSSVFENPQVSNHLIFSPDKVVRSPSQASLGSSLYQPSPSRRAKWFTWERKKSKECAPKFISGFQEVSVFSDSIQKPMKPAKPASKKPSPKHRNWFNDISEEEYGIEDQYQQLDLNAIKVSSELKWDDNAKNHHLRKSKSSIVDSNYDPKVSRTTTKLLPNIPPAQYAMDPKKQCVHSNETQRSSSDDSRKSELSQKPGPRVILSETDLHTQSFLALTSSEDESDDQLDSEALGRRRHRIRASIVKADTGDEVLVCSAERVKPTKPRPVVNRPRRRSLKKPGTIPPVPIVPAGPQPNPRVSSMRWQDEMKMLQVYKEKVSSPGHSREGSFASRSASRLSQIGSQGIPATRGSKMMAVTAEEEKLLEAMRRKRAAIRQDARAQRIDDIQQIHSNSNPVSRPKTAGADSCPRPLSYFDVDRSASSPPPTHGSAKCVEALSYAASVGNMSSEDFSPLPSPSSFPQTPAAFSIPSSMSKVILIRQPSKAAPSLSFSPSDLVPSTPAMSDATGEDMNGFVQHGSRTSPVTPPPGHVMDVYESELAIANSHPHDSVLYINKKNYDRKRAVNSSVFVLNDGEREAQDLNEESDITRWAVDKW